MIGSLNGSSKMMLFYIVIILPTETQDGCISINGPGSGDFLTPGVAWGYLYLTLSGSSGFPISTYFYLFLISCFSFLRFRKSFTKSPRRYPKAMPQSVLQYHTDFIGQVPEVQPTKRQ
jgi:hypothetical protein